MERDRETGTAGSPIRDRYTVDDILSPRSVAVVGASEDLTKFGGRILKSLVQHGFGGAIFPINRARQSLLGIQCYSSIAAVPAPPDVAVVAVPPDAVIDTIAALAAVHTGAVIVITAGFSDAGPAGARRESQMLAAARTAGMRIIGPNCLGLISPANNLVLCASPALFVPQLPQGALGLVSQSGAVMATIFDRAMARGVGFSHCFSIGNQADMELCDFVDFLIADPRTRVICTYLEGVKHPDRFLQTAQSAYRAGKPWLIVKAGRTASGAAAAFSHTASLAGSYEAFAAACRECGVLIMDDPDAMILLAAALSHDPRRSLGAVSVVTTSGGSGALTVDRLSDAGVPLVEFTDATTDALRDLYPPNLAGANPVDMGAALGGLATGVETQTMDAVMRDGRTGLVLAPITTAPDITKICENLVAGAQRATAAGYSTPYIVIMQPGRAGDQAREVLRAARSLYSDSLDEAIRALAAWQRLSRLRLLPEALKPAVLPARPAVEALDGAVDEAAAKRLLSSYGIPVNPGEVARDADDAERIAAGLRGPFVLKIVSPEIVHKSDVGGVVLGLQTAEDVRDAAADMTRTIERRVPGATITGYFVQEMRAGKLELFIGARRDPQFGAIILVGAGGILVELIRDVAVARAPLDTATAHLLLDELAIARLLHGYRGAALDAGAVADAVSRTSWLVHDLGDRFEELDINPVLVGDPHESVVAVDARLRLSSPGAGETRTMRSSL